MRRSQSGTVVICLAGVLALSAGARAMAALSADNPYAAIVARNVFGLNPPPTNNPAAAEEAQLPKIKPNGIMSILGQLQVLFKVSPKPGQKDAKEESYVLSEGQQQDDIEVVHIDELASLITFNNHGFVQEIPLASAPAAGGPAPSVPGRPGGGMIPTRAGIPRPPVGGGGGHQGGGPGRGVTVGGGPGTSAGANPGGNPVMGGGLMGGGNAAFPNQSGAGQQSANMNLSSEDQMVLMAAQHADALKRGDATAPLFPPTPYDAEAGIPTAPPNPQGQRPPGAPTTP